MGPRSIKRNLDMEDSIPTEKHKTSLEAGYGALRRPTVERNPPGPLFQRGRDAGIFLLLSLIHIPSPRDRG